MKSRIELAKKHHPAEWATHVAVNITDKRVESVVWDEASQTYLSRPISYDWLNLSIIPEFWNIFSLEDLGLTNQVNSEERLKIALKTKSEPWETHVAVSLSTGDAYGCELYNEKYHLRPVEDAMNDNTFNPTLNPDFWEFFPSEYLDRINRIMEIENV